MNREKRIPRDIKTFHPMIPRKTVKRAAGIKKGTPSLAMGHLFCSITFSSFGASLKS
jgi:hypothetical protein